MWEETTIVNCCHTSWLSPGSRILCLAWHTVIFDSVHSVLDVGGQMAALGVLLTVFVESFYEKWKYCPISRSWAISYEGKGLKVMATYFAMANHIFEEFIYGHFNRWIKALRLCDALSLLLFGCSCSNKYWGAWGGEH